MRDVFDAIERLSALLAMRIENAARKRGWPTKTNGRTLSPMRGRLVALVGTTLLLPRGEAATFVPRPEAEGNSAAEDARWVIDIRRSDGVMRKSWQNGVQVGRTASGTYALLLDGAPLSDESVDTWLEDLSKPGPSGISLWVRKVWGIRFGRMTVEISDLLERVQDADRLDQIHAAVLRAVDRAEAEASIVRIVG